MVVQIEFRDQIKFIRKLLAIDDWDLQRDSRSFKISL